MIDVEHLTAHLIEPALWRMEERCKPGRKFYTLSAIRMIGRIAAQVSDRGTYWRQLGNGPALGLLQIEPATCQDVWREVIGRQDDIEAVVRSVLPHGFNYMHADSDEHLVFNVRYNIMIGRLCLWRHREPLPAYDDIDGQFDYYNKYFNSLAGHATLESWRKKNPYPVGKAA